MNIQDKIRLAKALTVKQKARAKANYYEYV